MKRSVLKNKCIIFRKMHCPLNVKKLKSTTLGEYIPAFFKINLGFVFPSNYLYLTLSRLSPKELSIFVHEYIHFIQDISTTYGVKKAYVYSEFIHGSITKIYEHKYGEIEVPILFDDNYANIDVNMYVNEFLRGDGAEKEEDPFFIKNVFIKKENLSMFGISKSIDYVEIVNSQRKKFKFGAAAIEESMAYIIEQQISQPNSTPSQYPYEIAQLLAEHECNGISNNILNILALCDVSLLSDNPGFVFYSILQYYKKTSIPQYPEHIYDYFHSTYSFDETEKCYQIFKLGNRIKKYIQIKNLPVFCDFENLIHNLIGTIWRYRREQPFFILELAKKGYALNNPIFCNLLNQIGTPLIEDKEKNYTITPPLGTKNMAIQIFWTIQQIYNLFYSGAFSCEEKALCQKTDGLVDARCDNEPWERCKNGESLCLYASIWRHWNLLGYKPIRRK